MADLIQAAQTQLRYAGNEYRSGDSAKGEEHLKKADAFLTRARTEGSTQKIAAAEPPEADWSGSWNEAYARWLDAADEALIAAGKPAGRDGAERGALNREESIAIAKRIGVFDELGGEDGIWGPATPGAST